MSQAGRLDFENGRYVIRIKAAEPGSRGDREIDPTLLRGRQRFSVAHELGHALLLQTLTDRRELLASLRDPDEWERIESLCDQAAAELLVPMDSFIAGVQRHGVSPESLDGLAQDFAVSREVIFRRFLAGGAHTGGSSRSLAPNIVLRAAMRGRAQSAKLKLTSGPASWGLAGVAEARNPIQPSGPTQEAEILLLLFHEAAPAAKEPLWSAVASRRTH